MNPPQVYMSSSCTFYKRVPFIKSFKPYMHIYISVSLYLQIYVQICICVWQHTPVFLPGKFHGQRSGAAYIPLGLNGTQLSMHTIYTTYRHMSIPVYAHATLWYKNICVFVYKTHMCLTHTYVHHLRICV